ncbi:hypothetical protein [Mycobacterium uberis]|uniref:hypothetical protein n=1 Tax=Mycobacterium uberis TaxID=2162698 RepID=UPI000E3015FC|nr:hypothetical protein [Mycobacterium uberis]
MQQSESRIYLSDIFYFFSDTLHNKAIGLKTDGKTVIVLVANNHAHKFRENPVWIAVIKHRIEPTTPSVHASTESPSTTAATKTTTQGNTRSLDVAEIHAPFTHQQLAPG